MVEVEQSIEMVEVKPDIKEVVICQVVVVVEVKHVVEMVDE